MTRAIVVLALLGAMGCHGRDAQAPKAETTAPAPTKTSGLESSEAVARAYAKVLNEGTLEAGLALYPTDAMIDALVACASGPNPMTAEVQAQRKQLSETLAGFQKALKEGKLAVAYVGPGESQSMKKGTVKEGCTVQDDFEVKQEAVSFETQSSMRLTIIKMGGSWYLFNAPK